MDQNDQTPDVKVGSFKIKSEKCNKDGELIRVVYTIKEHSVIAALLADDLQDRLAYDPTTCLWSYYTGHAWIPCKPGQAEEAICSIFETESTPGGYGVNSYKGSVQILKDTGKLKLPPVCNNVIPFKNGLLDIPTRTLQPITPQTAQRWYLPYDYKPTVGPAAFLRWLDARFADRSPADRADIIKTLQAFINASVTGKSKLQIYLHLKGVSGSGKSMIVRVLQELFSIEAVVASSLENLATSKFESTKLEGDHVRLLVLSELKRHNTAKEYQKLKTLSGRDPMTGEDKYLSVKRTPAFTFAGQIVITSNPNFSLPPDDAGAIGRRALPIEFHRSLTAQEQGDYMVAGGEDEILQEAPAIVQWSLELSDAEVIQTLVNPPQVIVAARQQAEYAGNPLARWIEDCLVYDPAAKPTLIGAAAVRMEGGRTHYGDVDDEQTKLFPSFLGYCRDNRIQTTMDVNTFSGALIETARRLFQADEAEIFKKRTNVGMAIKGLRIATDLDKYSRTGMLDTEGGGRGK